MKKSIVYGYFTLKDVEIKGQQVKANSVIYIGIDNTPRLIRWHEHTKPSKRYVQEINTWLQDRQEGEDWVYVPIVEMDCYDENDSKQLVHLVETFYVDREKPVLNVYKK